MSKINIDKNIKKMVGGKSNIDFSMNKMLGKKLNFPKMSSIPSKKDWDGDGIPNKKDYQPNNIMRQDWDYNKAKNIKYMSPTLFLKKTEGLNTPQSQRQWLDKGYYDIETKQIRPINELREHIKSPNKQVNIPYLGSRSGTGIREHKGRHRAYAAELAGEKLIPVRVEPYNNMMGDKDGDGVKNFIDCDPNDADKQGPWHKRTATPDRTVPPDWGRYSKKKKEDEEELGRNNFFKDPPWSLIKEKIRKKEQAEMEQQTFVNDLNRRFVVKGNEDDSYKYDNQGNKLNKKFWKK